MAPNFIIKFATVSSDFAATGRPKPAAGQVTKIVIKTITIPTNTHYNFYNDVAPNFTIKFGRVSSEITAAGRLPPTTCRLTLNRGKL